MSGINSTNVSLVYIFELNGAFVKSGESRAKWKAGWDCDHYNAKMSAEKDALTWDTIKGDNTDIGDVKSALTLPQCSRRTAPELHRPKLSWSASEPDVISLKEAGDKCNHQSGNGRDSCTGSRHRSNIDSNL